MSKQWIRLAIIGTLLTIAGPRPGLTQSSPSKNDTYTWNAELVSLDPAAKTMTVKSRVAYQEAVSELSQLKAGDRVWILWSGIHDTADAVRRVRRSDTGRPIDETLVLPAEFVSTEASSHYVEFRIPVPESGLAAIKTVKPGDWVTVTSRHRPPAENDAVVAVKPYVTSTTTS